MPSGCVTVSLPAEVVRDIDHLEQDRGKFILSAVRRELSRKRRDQLRRAFRNPHPESRELSATLT